MSTKIILNNSSMQKKSCLKKTLKIITIATVKNILNVLEYNLKIRLR